MKKDSGLFIFGLLLLIGGLISSFKGKEGEAIGVYTTDRPDFQAFETSSEQTFIFGFLLIASGLVCMCNPPEN
ncbi:hypothetical protein [Microbulbifer agarilyticus]